MDDDHLGLAQRTCINDKADLRPVSAGFRVNHPDGKRPGGPGPQRRHIVLRPVHIWQDVKHIARHIQQRHRNIAISHIGRQHHVDHRAFAHKISRRRVGVGPVGKAVNHLHPGGGDIGQIGINQTQRRVQHLDIQHHRAVARHRLDRIRNADAGFGGGQTPGYGDGGRGIIAQGGRIAQRQRAAIAVFRQQRPKRGCGQDQRTLHNIRRPDQPARQPGGKGGSHRRTPVAA